MNFKALFGFLFVALAGFMWFTEPEKAAWPALFGTTFGKMWTTFAAPDIRIYVVIICLVLGVAFFMTMKKY